ncbi:uncharacterized protein PV09_02737 [Verruconis gallopava]|uniref:Gag1-like clamp domain-containing protein n=1 Tax=Verruconis gallopava TaxID=253628 RepID=A0A0D2AI49_9PEZI|nr:uncharacterized protein PV09_02737 [Verruconis gallopava]KIW06265.1 hypothetical protein PV09_02737 [Verruconis gallopava]
MKELDKAAQAAVREINRKLQQQLRNDWEFPDPSALPQGVPPLQNQDPDISPASHGSASPPRTPENGPNLRERYYGTTDDSSDEEAHMIESMYAFDSPDTVGDEIDRKVTARRKRRKKELQEELQYNPGLCFFLRRRNAWTGAVPKTRIKHAAEVPQHLPATSSDSSPIGTPLSVSSVPAENATGSMEGVENTSTSHTDSITSISPWIPPSHAPIFQPPKDPDSLIDVLIPLAPPLIPPSNPVRMSLTSRSQSELYGKIVRDSRTPAIPINLADMTRIIVQGWKDEGNWPPRGTAPEPSIASKRGAPNAGNKFARSKRDDGILANHPHLQRGVEGMKRVFRLSNGSHHDSDGSKAANAPVSPKSPKYDLSGAFRSH